MKPRRAITFIKFGIDLSNTLTKVFMLETEFMDFRGLRNQTVLRTLSYSNAEIEGMDSIIADKTTRKSRKFHSSQRYEFLFNKNPFATIFKRLSKMKIMLNATPSSNSVLFSAKFTFKYLVFRSLVVPIFILSLIHI